MFTEHERDYFEDMLKAQFREVHSKLDHIHAEVKRTNGRVSKAEGEIDILKTWMASSKGSWNGINKIAFVFWSILTFTLGIIAIWKWH